MARRRFTRRARLAALRNLRKARLALRRRTHKVRRATHRRRFTAKARAASLRNLRKARAARRGHRVARRSIRRVRHGRAYRIRLARLRSLRLARRARRSGRTKRAYASVDSRYASAMSPGGDFFGMGANPKRVNRKTKRGKSVAARKRIAAALKRRRGLKGRVVIFPGGRVAVFHKPGTAAFRAGRAKKKAMGRRLARMFGFKKKHRKARKARKGRKARRRNPGFMWR